MSADWDVVKAGFQKLVKAGLPRIDYLALYPCKVVVQNGDGTLDLQPEDIRVSREGIQHVPIRIGIPGATVKVAPGARVLLGFEGGSPAAPVATLWDSASVLEVVLETAALKLGGSTAVEAVVRGTTYRAAEDAMLTALAAALTAIGAALAGAEPKTAPPGAAVALTAGPLATATAVAAISAFQAAASTYLSPVTKTL